MEKLMLQRCWLVRTTPTLLQPFAPYLLGKVIIQTAHYIHPCTHTNQTPLRNPMGLEDDAFPLGVKRPIIFRVGFREGIISGATGGPLWVLFCKPWGCCSSFGGKSAQNHVE